MRFPIQLPRPHSTAITHGTPCKFPYFLVDEMIFRIDTHRKTILPRLYVIHLYQSLF